MGALPRGGRATELLYVRARLEGGGSGEQVGGDWTRLDMGRLGLGLQALLGSRGAKGRVRRGRGYAPGAPVA